MATLDGQELQIAAYDTGQYRFQSWLTRATYERYVPGEWAVEDPKFLENIHQLHSWLGSLGVGAAPGPEVIHTRETDQKAQHYRDLYRMGLHLQRPEFTSAYLDFLEHEVWPRFDGQPLAYQEIPTLRVHPPGNVAVGEYHTDAKYKHLSAAVNFWVPATKAHDTNALHILTSTGDKPQPVAVNYGQYIIFDAVNLLHGNEVNKTRETRVSFDFRVIPEDSFVPSDDASINTGRPFKIGEGCYYSLLTHETLQQERQKLAQQSLPCQRWLAMLAEERQPTLAFSELSLPQKAGRLAQILFTSRT